MHEMKACELRKFLYTLLPIEYIYSIIKGLLWEEKITLKNMLKKPLLQEIDSLGCLKKTMTHFDLYNVIKC